MGFKVTFGKNVRKVENEYFNVASVKDRVEDLLDAFKDTNDYANVYISN